MSTVVLMVAARRRCRRARRRIRSGGAGALDNRAEPLVMVEDPAPWAAALAVLGLPLLLLAVIGAPVWALVDAVGRRRRDPEQVGHWIVFLAVSLLALPLAVFVALAYAWFGRNPRPHHGRDRPPDRRAAYLFGGALLAGGALAAPLGAWALDEDRRLRACHDPDSQAVDHVSEAVTVPMAGEPVAVRHRGFTFISVLAEAGRPVATFGLDGATVVAVNEEARRISSARFDFLFGSRGAFGEDPQGRDLDAGRKAAIDRVEGCAARSGPES